MPFTINSKIVNQGSSDEIDITGSFIFTETLDTVNYEENQIYEHLWTIDSLDSGDDTMITFNYTLPRGLYRISINISSVPGEEIHFNNNMNLVIFIGENLPPNQPVKPNGYPIILPNRDYKFYSSTTDPDGDKVYYQCYWGIDQMAWPVYSDWLGPYESGETITIHHTWPRKAYVKICVQVRAMDIYSKISSWSETSPTFCYLNTNFNSKTKILQ